MKVQVKFSTILNIVLVVLFLALTTFITIKYAPYITGLIKQPDKFRNILASYGSVSVLVFLFFQVLQVVVAAIPGEVVQLAGGYVYGTFFGAVYSCLGILIGAITVFYIARLLGYKLVRTFVSAKTLEKFNFLINSPKSEIAMFILFLTPGLPKDFLAYIAGLTPIKPLRFFTILTVARFPSILGASYIGAHLQERNYMHAIVVSAVALVFFVAGILMRDRVVSWVHRLLYK